MQLVSKLARARIGDDVWQSGDGILLPSITITLGEDQRSSSCRFTVADPGLLIGAKYREISVTQGGIQVPDDLLEGKSPSTGSSTQGATPSTATLGSGETSNVPLAIVRECLRQGVTDPVKIAFILAVAEGESSFNYRAYNPETTNPNVPDKRYGGRGLVQITQRYNYEYFGRILGVDLVGNPDLAFRPDIGLYLLVAGIKRGWCGRGGLDRWVTGPGSIAAAYRAIQGGVWGERYQRFFERWQRDVGGLIQQAGGQAEQTPPPPKEPMEATPAEQGTPQPQQMPPVVETSKKGTEIIIELAVGWGLGFKDAIAFHFIHTSTETNWDASGTQTTTFGGQSVRWLLTRTPVTESFENMTFRQYLESRCRAFGLQLEMEGNGLRYQHLSQDGQTHLELILREARRIGFSIREGTGSESGKLIVEPSARPTFTNFIIDEEVLIKPARFTDQARAASSGQSGATVSSPGTGAGETTTAIDRATGTVAQTQPQSQAGTGNAPNATNATPGAATPPVGGTVQPSGGTAAAAPGSGAGGSGATETDPLNNRSQEGPRRTKRADGAEVTTNRITENKAGEDKITRTITTRTVINPPNGTPTAETRVEVIEITEAGRKITLTVTPAGGSPTTTTREEPLTAEDRRLLALLGRSPSEKAASQPAAAPGTGLPNQPAGAIDLADGRAEAMAIADESRRIRGYEDTVTLVMNSDTLQLVPGQIVALSKRLFPDAFATEKRIAQVAHDFASGTTTIQTYTPQAAPPASAAGGSGGVTQFASPATPSAPGGFIFPIPRGATTIGDGFGTRRGRAPGYRHSILDITAPAGTPVVAMADGVITRVALNAGGAGHLMTIAHAGGYVATYMHGQAGQPFIVREGQVKQGQPVFRVGTTGASSGNHLHLSFRHNGAVCLLSKVGLDVLRMGLPVRRFNETCNQY